MTFHLNQTELIIIARAQMTSNTDHSM